MSMEKENRERQRGGETLPERVLPLISREDFRLPERAKLFLIIRFLCRLRFRSHDDDTDASLRIV